MCNDEYLIVEHLHFIHVFQTCVLSKNFILKHQPYRTLVSLLVLLNISISNFCNSNIRILYDCIVEHQYSEHLYCQTFVISNICISDRCIDKHCKVELLQQRQIRTFVIRTLVQTVHSIQTVRKLQTGLSLDVRVHVGNLNGSSSIFKIFLESFLVHLNIYDKF